MKRYEYFKTLSPEKLAHEMGKGLQLGENKGCDCCECKDENGNCDGCDAATLRYLNDEVDA